MNHTPIHAPAGDSRKRNDKKPTDAMPFIDPISVATKKALKEGDHQAYREIYLHYWDSLYGFLSKLISDREEAKEFTQDVLMTLWTRREQIDPGQSIKAYLYTIARNKALMYFRHKKVLEKYSAQADFDDRELVAADDILIAEELAILTDIAVSQMPETRQQVFQLSRNDVSVEEIAARLGISRDSVYSHLSLARKELRSLILVFLIFLQMS